MVVNEKSEAEVLAEIKLAQCRGGYSQFVGERKGVLELAFHKMRTQDLDFGDAIRQSWKTVKAKRLEPCSDVDKH